MSGECKFRVWDGEVMNTVSGLDWTVAGIKWYGPGVGDGWCYLDSDFDWSQKNCNPKPERIDILMQYTGLKDKNGVDLNWWEGDLLAEGEKIMEIVHEDGCFWGVWVKHRENRTALHVLAGWAEHIKIIGNIHQNPELLGVE